MIIIGIVGSPAGGKSTVAKILWELGATWINADLIARSVLEESEFQERLLDHFGGSIQGSDLKIDRTKLAAAVFGSDDRSQANLNFLQSVIHPETKKRIAAKIDEATEMKSPAIALEVPLLFESKWDLVCDEIWCVDAPSNRRILWAKSRNWTQEDLKNRESNQLPLFSKKQRSNFVIMNDGDIYKLRAIVTDRLATLIPKTDA